MYIASRSFFAVPRCRVTKMHSHNSVIYSAVRLLLQMDIFYPYICKLFNSSKSILLSRPFWRVFTFATLCFRMVAKIVAYFARFSYGGEKGIISTAFYTDGNNIIAVSS